MGSFSIWHWLIVLVIVLLVFGPGRLPEMMGSLGKGLQEFKKGLREPPETGKEPESDDPSKTRRTILPFQVAGTSNCNRYFPCSFANGLVSLMRLRP